ncbi:hypothetical protein PInf_014418 [Phytophthora infestans]|nr:hypothetical protein PInf_014418 [Phytophthora infestans]
MITRGEAIVSEKAVGPDKKPYEKELTRLYEGHVFGEMSLIYSEPRTASVRAVGPVKCLYLSKEDFDKCLLSDHFQRFIQEAYVEKATRRAMRLRLQQPPTSPVKATETKKLVKQRLKNGQVVVNKYVIKGDLGRGTFGRVKLCESQEDGQMYAVKIMHKTFVQRMAGKEDQLYDVLRREVAIMKKLNHRNVVRLVEVIDDPNSQKMYLVQEYVQHSLMEEVTQARRLSEPVARKYMRDLLSGLQYLHFHKVIHRDIKPENILVSSDGVAKIADFGTARMIMNETETISGAKGTPAFMAPEMFDIDATYQGPAVDVWSLGATLYMMVIGHPPWMADNEIVLAERVQRVELRFPKDVERTMEPHLKNLLQRMLTKDPACRISLKECFTHEWTTKEGSDPLGLITPEKNLTVSMDESERAIENIPEQIDQRLTESLAQAHQLVKTRQETGPGVVRTNSGRHFTGTPMAGTLGARIPSTASTTSSINTVGSSPSRASSDEVSRIICAWRHHKRVQLMDGHKELSERSRELLIEQKRMAFSVDRAKVTEIILPAAKPTARSRYPSTSSSSSLRQVREQSALSTASSVSSMSTVGGNTPSSDSPRSRSFPAGRSNSVDNSLLLKKNSFQTRRFKDSGNLEGSVAPRSRLARSPRKKDFLMVTSEVFRDEGGDYQTRKILFQARDDDFSVASRVPTHSNSGRELLPPGRAGSTNSSSSRSVATEDGNVEEFDMDGIDCVQVTEIDDEDDDDLVNHGMRKGSGASSRHFHHHSDSSRGEHDSDDSDYSDVECDVDVDATFSELIATPNQLDIISHDDEEIAPIVTQKPSLTGNVLTLGSLASMASSESALAMATPSSMLDIVQVYVSSKIRENLTLSIRSGYAEAKGARSYMEDRTTGQSTCDLSRYPAALANNYASLAFFAVYDGHNGTDTAVKLQNELHHRFFAEGAGFIESPVTCISSVCESIDNEILERQNQSVLPKRKRTMAAEEMQRYLRSESTVPSLTEDECCEIDGEIVCGEEMKQLLQPISFSGAASVFVVVAKQRKKRCRANDKEDDAVKDDEETETAEDELDEEDQPTRLYVANVGDCRAVLCTADALAVDMTTDHKASLPAEQERIEASGGFVHNGRLDGILQISRGFGDLAHKQDGHLVVTPDVVEHLVNPSDQFLLLASDGLFDVLTSQQAVNFVLRKLQTHGDVQLAAQELVLKAQAYFAHDNISVVIVALNQKGDA